MQWDRVREPALPLQYLIRVASDFYPWAISRLCAVLLDAGGSRSGGVYEPEGVGGSLTHGGFWIRQ